MAFAPRIHKLLAQESKGFLPADAPSQRALARLRDEFPDEAFNSRAVLLFERASGLTPQDREAAAGLAGTLQSQSETWGWRIRAAALQPPLRPVLQSADGQAELIVVDLPAGSMSRHTVNRVRQIEKVLAQTRLPDGLQLMVTGGAAMGALLEANAKRDVDQTTFWAIGAVAAILLLVYRSPVAMFLPLVSIAAALIVSLGMIGWAAQAGWPINSLVQMFVIVIVVGVGTDYCLFLYARFREDAARLGRARVAARTALVHSGPAILASAATNSLGLATLWLAKNRDLYTSGPTIGVSIVLAGAAVMTFSAALVIVAAPLLAPARHRESRGARVWQWAGELVRKHSLAVSTSVGLLLLAGSALGAAKRTHPLYDSVDQFPAKSSFVLGARAYNQHFHGGAAVTEATVLITFPRRVDPGGAADSLRPLLDGLARTLREKLPVVHYRDLYDPLGTWRAENGGENAAAAWTLPRGVVEQFARSSYLGRSGQSVRVDVGLQVEPRSIPAMNMAGQLKALSEEYLGSSPGAGPGSVVEIAGETAVYSDMRELRKRDFAVVGAAAIALIFLILLALLRSAAQSAILIVATLMTYLASYGATWLIARWAFGTPALAWQIDFLLFIVVLSLGQDYNIFVVARFREELKRHPPAQAVSMAVRRTGGVVSSCGVIMAATFASMFAGSLTMMKEFAIALSLAMLIDTFVVRPLFVPAMILVSYRLRPKPVPVLCAEPSPV